MSIEYDNYLYRHKDNVSMGFVWLRDNLPEVLKPEVMEAAIEYATVYSHDHSKFEQDEYDAYDAFFYGNNRSYNVVNNFRKAWLHHIHHNPHHWQHWVIINDDEKEGTIALEMPYENIVEMICDWWSFSWQKGDLYEIFKWYEEHEKRMILHDNTRKTIVDILNKIRNKLNEKYTKEI